MTLEELKAEMKQRGCSQAQMRSPTVAICLDIIGETGNAYENYVLAQTELEKIERKKSKLERAFNDKIEEYERWVNEKTGKIDAKIERLNEKVDYINGFREELNKMESKEARDEIRKIQLFLELSEDVLAPTSECRSAYIEAIGRILSSSCAAPNFAYKAVGKVTKEQAVSSALHPDRY